MTDEVEKLVKKMERREIQFVFYIIGFFVGVALDIVGFIFLYPFPYRIYFAGTIILALLGLLIILYQLLKSLTQQRLEKCVNAHLPQWKLQAIEATVAQIQSDLPVTLTNIDSFSNNYLMNYITQTYPSLRLEKLTLAIPTTDYMLQHYLAQNPHAGKYYHVEQQFVKNL